MYELMGTKKEDDEFVLQITHSLLSLLACQATRSVLLDSTQVSPHPSVYVDLSKRVAWVVHKFLLIYAARHSICFLFSFSCTTPFSAPSIVA